MPVSPQDLFDRALELFESADELKFREAANSAFYAAYHLLKSLEDEIGDPCQYDGGSHQQLVELLVHHPIAKVKGLGYMFRECLLRRRKATYDLDEEFSQNDAKLQMEGVTRIFEKVRELRKSGVDLSKV